MTSNSGSFEIILEYNELITYAIITLNSSIQTSDGNGSTIIIQIDAIAVHLSEAALAESINQ